MNYFAKNLKYLRRARDLSQEELGKKVGLNRGNIASYEKGSAEPNMTNLSKIGKFFKVDLGDLIEEDLSLRNTVINRMDGSETGEKLEEEKMEEMFVESLQMNGKKIEKFRKRSDEMARILDGFRQFHKFRMESSDRLSDDVKKMALDYEKLLDVLEEVLSTNKKIISLLES